MPDSEPTPTFEEALQQLQSIVADLEAGELGLDASLARFEEGVKLVKACHQLLEVAEQRIEILTGFNAQGQPVTAPLKIDATFDPEATGPKPRKTRRPAPVEPVPECSDPPNSLFS